MRALGDLLITRTRLGLGIILVIGLLLLAACQKDQRNEEDPCYATIDEEEIFLGTVDCLQTLPEEEICGYWLVGLEYSVFFDNIEYAERHENSRGYWLSLSDSLPRVSQFYKNDSPSLYAICIRGMKSDRHGYYADGFDDIAGGIFVRQFSKMELLSDDFHR